jgi:uncharacterized sulfatase
VTDVRPNIVWITLDSVRADHTSLHDYRRDTTPTLAELAAEGVSFSSCFAPGTSTVYSSASFLTGTYPFRNGLRVTNDFLPRQLSTVPELLGAVDYTTACLSRNAYISPGTGLDRGFDRFEWIDSSRMVRAIPFSILLGYALRIRRHSAGFTTDAGKHSTPYIVNRMAYNWLDDLEESEPFFFYLHYNEPHHPYYPPLPYIDRYVDDIAFSLSEATSFAMEMHEHYREWIANGREFTEAEMEALKALYDAEIRYTDEMIGRLVRHIDNRSLGETVVVVTADHGDFFGEKGLLSHVLSVDDAVTWTPLVVRGFDIDVDPETIIQQIDVMQTLLAQAGAKTDQFQGVDLRHGKREYAFTNRAPVRTNTWKPHNPDFDLTRYHADALASVRTQQFRYQKSASRAELYELPDEGTDVSDRYPTERAKLDEVLTEWWKTDGVPVDAEDEDRMTDEMRRQLRDLGYVE